MLLTGTWYVLSEAEANDPLHFAGTTPFVHPITGVNTGVTTREHLNAQGALRGWPLRGVYLSASGQGSLPHLCLHRLDFPSQTGAVGQRADKLQTQMEAAFKALYANNVGTVDESRSNWVSFHCYVYQSDPSLYVPRGSGAGHYAFRADTSGLPPANWWQEL